MLATLATEFEITQKFYADKAFETLAINGSLIPLEGIAVFLLLIFAGRGVSTLLLPGRRPLIELDANNIAYGLLRSGTLLSLCLLLLPCYAPLYQNLLPAITTAFYR